MEKPNFDSLRIEIKKILNEETGKDEKLKKICRFLKEEVYYYNWVGFYMADNDRRELTLGPFEGEDTEHKRIKFGSGICGQAAERKKTFLVKDISKEKNYLACSPLVKSEIVVPVFKNGELVAEIDIDSHFIDAFDEEDKKFLEDLAIEVSKIL